MDCQKCGDEYLFSVQDNGVGFDMNYAENIFKSFVRLHSRIEFEGTGIGLSIVKKVINRHGGKVWITAQVDKGATVCFTLPVEIQVGNLPG
jgi:light-regulated signal transduction histidine kinase (bacteriophytochrome)